MMKRLFSFLFLLMAAATLQVFAESVNSDLPSRSGDGVPIYSVEWSGDLTTTYTTNPYTGLSATYTDTLGVVKNTILTFYKGVDIFSTPEYPVEAGTYTVIASPVDAGDSLDQSTVSVTLVINPAIVSVENSVVVITKFFDGNDVAQVLNPGTLNGVLGNDSLTHTVEAHYDTPELGYNKDVTITYAIFGYGVSNYQLLSSQKVIHNGTIIENMMPDTNYGGQDGVNQGIEVEAYGYCTGSGAIEYHLLSGDPDQYKLVFDDPAFANVNWANLSTPGANGTININIPAGIVTGDYSATLTFRNHNYPTLLSPEIRISFHVNLPDTYVMPLFSDVIALVDTCHCLTDIQWYHRETGETQWTLIPGANDYYYRQDGGLTGEYFVSCKMNGVETFTCPQQDMSTLISDEPVSVKAYPNPASDHVNVIVFNSNSATHTLHVANTAGVMVESRSFVGDTTTIDLSRYQRGSYIVSVDGIVVQIVRN